MLFSLVLFLEKEEEKGHLAACISAHISVQSRESSACTYRSPRDLLVGFQLLTTLISDLAVVQSHAVEVSAKQWPATIVQQASRTETIATPTIIQRRSPRWAAASCVHAPEVRVGLGRVWFVLLLYLMGYRLLAMEVVLSHMLMSCRS